MVSQTLPTPLGCYVYLYIIKIKILYSTNMSILLRKNWNRRSSFFWFYHNIDFFSHLYGFRKNQIMCNMLQKSTSKIKKRLITPHPPLPSNRTIAYSTIFSFRLYSTCNSPHALSKASLTEKFHFYGFSSNKSKQQFWMCTHSAKHTWKFELRSHFLGIKKKRSRQRD